MVDLGNNDTITDMFVYEPKTSYVIASNKGYGFVVDENHLIAQTRQGRKIMNVAEGEYTMFCKKVTGDMIALVGENRKILIFKMEEIPTIARGHGVCLQKYKDGGLSDMQIFNEADGFSYSRSGGISVEKDLLTWLGHRAQVGKLAPFGFSKNNKFLK
jgi:topoisomerase-4 subunit A